MATLIVPVFTPDIYTLEDLGDINHIEDDSYKYSVHGSVLEFYEPHQSKYIPQVVEIYSPFFEFELCKIAEDDLNDVAYSINGCMYKAKPKTEALKAHIYERVLNIMRLCEDVLTDRKPQSYIKLVKILSKGFQDELFVFYGDSLSYDRVYSLAEFAAKYIFGKRKTPEFWLSGVFTA